MPGDRAGKKEHFQGNFAIDFLKSAKKKKNFVPLERLEGRPSGSPPAGRVDLEKPVFKEEGICRAFLGGSKKRVALSFNRGVDRAGCTGPTAQTLWPKAKPVSRRKGGPA